jgi:hypothetical protein
MTHFISEGTPMPVVYGVTNALKEISLMQYYRPLLSSTGVSLLVNASIFVTLPNNVYNNMESQLGHIEFKDGKTAVINKTATYIHKVFVNAYSSSPNSGIVAMDIVNSDQDSIKANAVASKNITPNSAEPLILTAIINHKVGDEIELRFGGGKVPGGTDLELNIISISWSILEK